MNPFFKILVLVFFGVSISSLASDRSSSPSHGISYAVGWKDWATIAVSHRNDNSTLRVIPGNEIAARAARSGDTNPWPDGAILGKVVWKDAALEDWFRGHVLKSEFIGILNRWT